METIMLLIALAVALNCLTMQVLMLKCLQTKQAAAPQEQLSEEEQEARRMAAEAQRRYEQGFVNLMNYDGMPAKKREGML